MSALKHIVVTVSLLFVVCIPEQQFVHDRLNAPSFEIYECSIKMDRTGNYSEAIHLKWARPDNDSGTTKYYTLLRKFPGDSLFDVFNLSQNIPDSVREFYDPLSANDFPTDKFDTLFYRVVAVDDYGRISDTSQPCRIIITPQPSFGSFNRTSGVFTWNSWVRGSQRSYAQFWNQNSNSKWTSPRFEAFPRTDEPAQFSVVLTNTGLELNQTKLYYALFMEISEMRSIRIGYLTLE